MHKRTLSPLSTLAVAATSLPAYAQTPERPGYWHGGWDWGWGHMLFGSVMMVLFWGGLILLIVFAVRWLGGGPGKTASRKTSLKRRSRFSRNALHVARSTGRTSRNANACSRTERQITSSVQACSTKVTSMDGQEGEKSRSQASSRLRRRVHDLVPAFLVTAAVLLVVEHWTHFDTTDLALLVPILASAAVHFATRSSTRSGSQGRSLSETSGRRRPF
jgi:putative membrane protein